jgi:hypothetical protein
VCSAIILYTSDTEHICAGLVLEQGEIRKKEIIEKTVVKKNKMARREREMGTVEHIVVC